MKVQPYSSRQKQFLENEAQKLEAYLKKPCGFFQRRSLKNKKKTLASKALEAIQDTTTTIATKRDKIISISRVAEELQRLRTDRLRRCPGGELGARLMMIRYLLDPLSNFGTRFRLFQILNKGNDPITLIPENERQESNINLSCLLEEELTLARCVTI